MDERPPPPFSMFTWPMFGLASMAQAGAAFAAPWLALQTPAVTTTEADGAAPGGITPSRIRLELETLRLRSYGASDDEPVLVCTPFALHGAAIADLASGHSIVERLLADGIHNLHLVEWRSAAPSMATLGIDDYLAALNVVVDDLGGRADLVGLCQGGWLSLIYAARFPGKVRRLVLCGVPVDLEAETSRVSTLARTTPLDVFHGLVKAGQGRVLGPTARAIWHAGEESLETIHETLQSELPAASPEFAEVAERYRTWDRWALNLPGRYYIEVVERLYHRNELATGYFTGLGRRIDLSSLRLPLFMLAGLQDDVVAPGQMLALRELAPGCATTIARAPCSHLGLFTGRRTLQQHWSRIAGWLRAPNLTVVRGSAG